MVPTLRQPQDRPSSAGAGPSVTLPPGRGGWWHEYVCPVHGVELEHDGLLSGGFPADGARCRYGCRLDTQAIRGAWTVLAHQTCATAVRTLAASEEPADRNEALRLLVEYADRYHALSGDHGGSQSWMLRGRLFHQALTEAIWAVAIGRAGWALRDRGVQLPATVASLLAGLADAALRARTILVEQGRERSNYVAWLDAAGAVCSRDPEWLTGEHGIHQHVLVATLPDGWHWEASTYYHAFVLRAALTAIAGVPDVSTPPPVAARLAAMRQVLVDLMVSDGEPPAIHDGPYRRDPWSAELAELDLVPDPDPRPVTIHRDGGCAVLRQAGIRAVLLFGPHGESHGHFDTLSLLLYGQDSAWQPDPGQVPYAHRDWRHHYASTAAHPTFSVDGLDQQPGSGRLVQADEDGVTVECDTAHPGVTATRTVRITGSGIRDELTVRSTTERRLALHLRPAVDLQVSTVADGFTTRWAGATVLTGHHASSAATTTLVRPGPGPADDPQHTVRWVDWVATGCTEITWTSDYWIE